jgi:23S rRNA maturation mini-RNase III
MTKSIAVRVEVPDWVDEAELKERVHNLARDFSDKHIRAKKLKEIAEELDFDEKELENFERSREKAWKQTKKEYGL